MPPPGMRPPGMKRGGSVKYKKGGSVGDDDTASYEHGFKKKAATRGDFFGSRTMGDTDAEVVQASRDILDASRLARPKEEDYKKGGSVKLARGGTADSPADTGTEADRKTARITGDLMGKNERLGDNDEDDADAGYKRGGGIKQGGDGSKQATEPGGYPVMKNAGGGGLGRLEKRSKGVR